MRAAPPPPAPLITYQRAVLLGRPCRNTQVHTCLIAGPDRAANGATAVRKTTQRGLVYAAALCLPTRNAYIVPAGACVRLAMRWTFANNKGHCPGNLQEAVMSCAELCWQFLHICEPYL